MLLKKFYISGTIIYQELTEKDFNEWQRIHNPVNADFWDDISIIRCICKEIIDNSSVEKIEIYTRLTTISND